MKQISSSTLGSLLKLLQIQYLAETSFTAEELGLIVLLEGFVPRGRESNYYSHLSNTAPPPSQISREPACNCAI